jgi:hypothetical protein
VKLTVEKPTSEISFEPIEPTSYQDLDLSRAELHFQRPQTYPSRNSQAIFPKSMAKTATTPPGAGTNIVELYGKRASQFQRSYQEARCGSIQFNAPKLLRR